MIERLTQIWYETPKKMLIPVVWVLMMVKSGVWFMPNIHHSFTIAQNPFINPFTDRPDAHYLMSNWLMPFIAWLTHANTHYAAYFALNAVFVFAFFGLMVWGLFKQLPEQSARTALAIFTLLPVSFTAFYWIGTDGLTLLLLTALLVWPRLWVACVCGVLLGMQHFEQGLFAIAAVAGALSVAALFKLNQPERYTLSWAYTAFISVCVGRLILAVLFDSWGIVLDQNRVGWMMNELPRLLSQFAYGFQTILWSVLALGWGIFVHYCHVQKRQAIPLSLAVMGLCMVLPFVADQTRVLSIVTFPVFAVFILFQARYLEAIPRPFIILCLCAWVLMPISWVWTGLAQDSVLGYTIAAPLSYLTGWPALPAFEQIPTWPFR